MSDPSSWRVTTHDWTRGVDLDHLEALRDRSGNAAAGGRRHLILEVLAYADEEAASLGRVGTAVVTTHADGRVTIADDGRGTDTRRDAAGRVIRKPVMATADVRFLDRSTAPSLPDGLPRRGMSSVAGVSSELVHENHRETGSWSQSYRFGVPDRELVEVAARGGSGTTVSFRTEVPGPPDLGEADLIGFPWLRIELRMETAPRA